MELTTSNITSLVNSYVSSQVKRSVTPLSTKKSQYQSLVSVWGNVSSKLSALKTVLEDLQNTSSNKVFNTKSVSLSSTNFLSATAGATAPEASYNIRVNQLAKADTLYSSTFNSGDSAGSLTPGIHKISFQSGGYSSNVNVEITGSETVSELMSKVSSAMNADTTANVDSARKLKDSGTIDIDDSNNKFKIDIDGTETEVTVENGSGLTYEEVIDRIASAVNSTVSGINAEKVITSKDGSDYVGLKISAQSSSQYISIDNSSNSLLQDLEISADKEKGAASLASATVFSPQSGLSKFSLSAINTGYSNILNVTSSDLFTVMGLTEDVLTNRFANTNDGVNTSDTKAGFLYGTRYLDAGLVEQGVAETETNNKLNAKIVFNGINIQRDSNTITDLVQDMTFELKSVMKESDETTTVKIGKDTSALKTKIDEFISKFNDVYTYMKGLSTTDSSGNRGVFVGEATASAIMNALTANAYSQVSGIASGEISFLSQIGIKFDSKTGFSISDNELLTNAITNKTEQVKNLFASENGIASKMFSSVESYIKTNGMISNVQKSYNDNIKWLSDKIGSTEARIDKSAESLRKKYELMQAQYAAMLQMQSDYSSFWSY